MILHRREAFGDMEIELIFKEIDSITEVFIQDLEKSFTDLEKINIKKRNREYIKALHNRFSKLELILRDMKEEEFGDSELDLELSETVDINSKELKKLKKDLDTKTFKMLIWVKLFKKRIKEIKTIIEKFISKNYKYKYKEDILTIISRLYRQIYVVHKVIDNKAFTEGSAHRKIKIKE